MKYIIITLFTSTLMTCFPLHSMNEKKSSKWRMSLKRKKQSSTQGLTASTNGTTQGTPPSPATLRRIKSVDNIKNLPKKRGGIKKTTSRKRLSIKGFADLLISRRNPSQRKRSCSTPPELDPAFQKQSGRPQSSGSLIHFSPAKTNLRLAGHQEIQQSSLEEFNRKREQSDCSTISSHSFTLKTLPLPPDTHTQTYKDCEKFIKERNEKRSFLLLLNDSF